MKETHKNQSKKNASYSRNRSKKERRRHPTSSAVEKQNNIGCGQRPVAALMAISQETKKVSCLANFKSLEKLDLKFNSLIALEVKILEALQDIEMASRLVGFDANSDDSIDDNYKKLHCDVSPLPHDSEDFRLVEKFLHTTHAPTHMEVPSKEG